MKLLLLLSLLSAWTQDPIEVGEAGKAPLFAETATGLAERVDQGTYNGVVALVEIGGERVVEEVHGLRSREPERPMEIDTIFRIYSMTKPITGVAAMMLTEEGKLGLDDPVSKYIPAFEHLTVGAERAPVEREMTVRDLHRHTAGLTYGVFAASEVDTMVLEAKVFDPSITLEEMTLRLGEIPLKTQPGSTFEYSLASDVLGRVVEVVSGMPLDEFFQKRVFDPLGMVDTGFHVPKEKRDRAAVVYRRSGRSLTPANDADEDPTVPPRLLSGGGGLFSTGDDYISFCRMLLDGGELDGKRILAEETVALMASDQLGEIGGDRTALSGGTFGLSMAVVNRTSAAGPNAGTSWWGGLAGTGFWIDPQEDVIAVFMIQNIMELNHVFVFQSDFYGELRR